MLLHKIAQYTIALLTVLIAYIFTITPAGYFRAWVAKKMGDSTAEDLGFLTLDPLVHTDFFGVIILSLYGVGWGKNIPVNPGNIHGPHRTLKTACAFFSGVAIHLILASLALFLFLFMFGTQAAAVQDSAISSATLAVGRIILAYIQLNVFLAAVSLVVNGVTFIFFHASEKYGEFSTGMHYLILLLPIILFLIFSVQIQHGIMYIITGLSSLLASVFGSRF